MGVYSKAELLAYPVACVLNLCQLGAVFSEMSMASSSVDRCCWV